MIFKFQIYANNLPGKLSIINVNINDRFYRIHYSEV